MIYMPLWLSAYLLTQLDAVRYPGHGVCEARGGRGAADAGEARGAREHARVAGQPQRRELARAARARHRVRHRRHGALPLLKYVPDH